MYDCGHKYTNQQVFFFFFFKCINYTVTAEAINNLWSRYLSNQKEMVKTHLHQFFDTALYSLMWANNFREKVISSNFRGKRVWEFQKWAILKKKASFTIHSGTGGVRVNISVVIFSYVAQIYQCKNPIAKSLKKKKKIQGSSEVWLAALRWTNH